MVLYKFERLIKKYTVDCQFESTTEGSWVAGSWVAGTPTTQNISGAIVPMTERRINNSGGDYKSGDCEFITTSPLAITSDSFIIYKNKKYKLEENTDYSDYADFYNYVARRVSAFDTASDD